MWVGGAGGRVPSVQKRTGASDPTLGKPPLCARSHLQLTMDRSNHGLIRDKHDGVVQVWWLHDEGSHLCICMLMLVWRKIASARFVRYPCALTTTQRALEDSVKRNIVNN